MNSWNRKLLRTTAPRSLPVLRQPNRQPCRDKRKIQMAVPEPASVYPEAAFQSAVVSVVEDVLRAENRRFALMERFGLDVAVFLDASPATVRLLEVKAFNAQRMGGVGFGNGRGIGPQVDLLLFGED